MAPALINIFYQYGILDSLGLFIRDRAPTNDVALRLIGHELGFIAKEVRIYCNGYLINLIAKAAIFSESIVSFKAILIEESDGRI